MVDKLVKGENRVVFGLNSSNRVDWVPVEHVALAHVLAEEALVPTASPSSAHSLTDQPSKRVLMGGQAYFVGNNESKPFAWMFGKNSPGSKPSVCHWEHPYPIAIPFYFIMSLSYINEWFYRLTSTVLIVPGLKPALIDYATRTYTFRSKKAELHFGYVPPKTVEESVRSLVKDYQTNPTSFN